MTKFLTELVTDDTPIFEIKEDKTKSKEEKYRVIDIGSILAEIYIKNLYFQNGQWYYFKKDVNNFGYKFYIVDELMGSYLAKLRNLPTVSYQVATVDDEIGIASINFKQTGYNYYTLDQLTDIGISSSRWHNLSFLRNRTVDFKNEEQFLKHLFDLFALDIHMLQMDRGYVNLQFQVNKQNNHFDIAPLYDYAHCMLSVRPEGIDVPNHIFRLNDFGIEILLQQFPMFKDSLEQCLDYDMKKVWDQICLDYHLNQDCLAYKQVKDYYENKDRCQKQYIKTLLSNSGQIKKLS